ncbi:MAG: hypothetical protein PVF38_14510, partial [Desulfobacterales bacterium]
VELIYSPDVPVSIKGAMKTKDHDRISASPMRSRLKIDYRNLGISFSVPGVPKRFSAGYHSKMLFNFNRLFS